MSSETYLSSEDSALLREVLSDYSGERCLEIAAGNGGGLALLTKRFRQVAGTDLKRPGSSLRLDENASFVLADSASCFRDASFDLVAFNPPYLPSDRVEDSAVDGGEGGVETTLRFLSDALRVVKPEGKVVMLLSSENPKESIERTCSEDGRSIRRLATRHLFYEDLSVYEVTARTAG